MIKVKAIVATNKPDLNGRRFSKNALKQIAKQAGGLIILHEFNLTERPIGIVLSGHLVGGKVCITAQLLEETAGYIVPAYFTKRSLDKIDYKIKLISFGLTQNPADKTLTPWRHEGREP